MISFKATGYFYEDFEIGAEVNSPGRTISDADVDMFLDWTGAPSRDSSVQTAPRSLLVNLADMLMQRIGIVEGTGYCNLGWSWAFREHVNIGDTIWLRAVWTDKRESTRTEGVGIVSMEIEMVNQADQIVATATWAVMILMRDKPAAWRTA